MMPFRIVLISLRLLTNPQNVEKGARKRMYRARHTRFRAKYCTRRRCAESSRLQGCRDSPSATLW
eukprot:700137-Amphidinium_carterae.1